MKKLFLTLEKSLSEKGIRNLIDNIHLLGVDAFDAEGFVFWENSECYKNC